MKRFEGQNAHLMKTGISDLSSAVSLFLVGVRRRRGLKLLSTKFLLMLLAKHPLELMLKRSGLRGNKSGVL